MVTFNWLHLTDLHMGSYEQDCLWPQFKNVFFDDLKKLSEICGPWDLVLFTGDMTHKGTTEHFNKFDQFLQELWEHIGNKRKRSHPPFLLAVPGNHDLVRPEINAPNPALKHLLNFYVHNEFWSDERYREPIKKAFESYDSWWKGNPFRPRKKLNHGDILPGDFSYTFEKEGAKLGIVGLNSSFLQLAKGDHKEKLKLHSRQFNSVCDNNGPRWCNQHHVCLLLTHHPTNWLDSDSQKELNGEINYHSRFAVHLCGHMHESYYSEIGKAGAPIKKIWQGNSLCGLKFYENYDEENKSKESTRLHGYTAGRIVLNGSMQAQIMFWPREARLQGDSQRIFVPDYSIKLTDDYNHHITRSFDLNIKYSGLSRKKLTGGDPVDNLPGVLNFIDDISKNYQALILSHRTAILQWYSLQNTLRGFTEILSKYAIPPADKTKPIPILVWILDFGLDPKGHGNAEVAHWNYQIFKAAVQSVASIFPDEHFTSGLGKSLGQALKRQLRDHYGIKGPLFDRDVHLLAWDQLINRVCVIVKGLTKAITNVHKSKASNINTVIYEDKIPGDDQAEQKKRLAGGDGDLDFDIGDNSILAIKCPDCWSSKSKILQHSTNIYQNPEPKLEIINGRINLALENTSITDRLGGFGLYVTLNELPLDHGNWKDDHKPKYWAWLDRNILRKITRGAGESITDQDRMTALTERDNEVLYDLGPAEKDIDDGMLCAYLAAYYHLMKKRGDLPYSCGYAYRIIKGLDYDILTLPEFLTYPKFSNVKSNEDI